MGSTAIKDSESLAAETRRAAANSDRSLAGQIDSWARLGRAIEPTLSPAFTTGSTALRQSKGPFYEADREHPDAILRVNEDGSRTPGPFLVREFARYTVARSISNRIA